MREGRSVAKTVRTSRYPTYQSRLSPRGTALAELLRVAKSTTLIGAAMLAVAVGIALSRVVMLDDDGIARAAGEIFDQPSLARPLAGDELNGLLPEKFFVLQDELRARARQLVVASQEHNHAAVAEAFGGLARTCVSCHQAYLYETTTAPRTGDHP